MVYQLEKETFTLTAGGMVCAYDSEEGRCFGEHETTCPNVSRCRSRGQIQDACPTAEIILKLEDFVLLVSH